MHDRATTPGRTEPRGRAPRTPRAVHPVRPVRPLLAALALIAGAPACGSEAHAAQGTAEGTPDGKSATGKSAGTTRSAGTVDLKSSKSAPASHASRPESFFGEWFAAGSGCRATRKKPGDVAFEAQGITPDAPGAIRGRFLLKDYKLSSPPPDPKTSIAFARECNVRIQVTPPEGKRVKGVSARTSWQASKDATVKLQLQNTLYMDTTIVGAIYNEIPEGEKLANREFEVVLSPGRFVGVPEAPAREQAYACGAMVVFGSDFTIIAHRKEKGDAALVRPAGNERALDFAVELEDCPSK